MGHIINIYLDNEMESMDSTRKTFLGAKPFTLELFETVIYSIKN